MLFGRQKNMVRRTYRPNETHHRDMRRQGVDRAAMLEASKGRRRKRSWLAQIFSALFGRGRR